MWWRAFFLLIFSYSAAQAQLAGPGIPGVADHYNATGTAGYQLGGTTVLNTLAHTSSPILSPEYPAQNTYDQVIPPNYLGQPIVQGYNTADNGVATYSQMRTTEVTVNGANSNHYGVEEDSYIFMPGTGAASSSGELNGEKFYFVLENGVTATTAGEPIESWAEQDGAGDPTLFDIRSSCTYGSTASGGMTCKQFDGGFNNANSGGTGIQDYVLYCEVSTGTAITLGNDNCIYNNDANKEIISLGHLSFRKASSQPSCTNCTIDANASDEVGTITESTGQTTATLTFHVAYPSNAPYVYIYPPGGATLPDCTTSTTAISCTGMIASDTYNYLVIGSH